jgi:endonuclease III
MSFACPTARVWHPGRNPLEVEQGLLRRVPESYRIHAHHWLILHGRYVCLARRPLCERCTVAACCDHARTGGVPN